MKQFILTTPNHGDGIVLPPGWTVENVETIEEANRRRAIAEADLAEAKLAVVRSDVVTAGGNPTFLADVHVHVFGKEYVATVDVHAALLLLTEVAVMPRELHMDVDAMSRRLSAIVDASVLSRTLWGRQYQVFVKGNHIAFVRPDFESRHWQRGY